MKFFVLTATALLTAGAVQAQNMTASPTPTSPSAGSMGQATGPTTAAPADTMTPPTSGATADSMSEKLARQKLAGAGYGSVSSLKRNADGQWEAVTKKAGKEQRVTVAADGSVSPSAPM